MLPGLFIRILPYFGPKRTYYITYHLKAAYLETLDQITKTPSIIVEILIPLLIIAFQHIKIPIITEIKHLKAYIKLKWYQIHTFQNRVEEWFYHFYIFPPKSTIIMITY